MHVASWHETYRGIVPDAMPTSLSVERRAESWQRTLGDPVKANDSTVAVAGLDGELVGLAPFTSSMRTSAGHAAQCRDCPVNPKLASILDEQRNA